MHRGMFLHSHGVFLCGEMSTLNWDWGQGVGGWGWQAPCPKGEGKSSWRAQALLWELRLQQLEGLLTS